MTSRITYLGELRTSCEHLQSGTVVLTDAPLDNHGKGEAFSPTDLVATSLGSCMMTIMAIKAQELGVELKDSTIDITKVMQSEPRKISKIVADLHIPVHTSEKNQVILERVAMNCPVLLSLHPDIEKDITFHWMP